MAQFSVKIIRLTGSVLSANQHAILTNGPARKALGLLLAAATVALFLINLRCAGERVGRAAERLDARERNDAIHRQMLDAASRRPADRDALVGRLRAGRF